MPLLFSYGTLQQDEVQLATFGRQLAEERDALAGFVLASVPVEGPHVTAATGMTHYANVVRTRGENERVVGMVLEVTEDELAAADRYEAPAGYRRELETLVSGKSAWVYRWRGPE